MGERRRQRRRRYWQNVRGWGEEWKRWADQKTRQIMDTPAIEPGAHIAWNGLVERYEVRPQHTSDRQTFHVGGWMNERPTLYNATVSLPADLFPISPALEQWATQQVHSQWNDTLGRWESIPPEEQLT